MTAYPACGNVTLNHEDVTWYPVMRFNYQPFDPSLQARADEILAVDRVPPPSAGAQGFAKRVIPPEPGDDIGTLVV